MKKATTATALFVGFLLMVSAPWAQAAPKAAAAPRVHAATVSFVGFAPRHGTMGDTVIITGTGFRGATSVAFHGVTTTFKVISNTKISATVPCGATSGRLTVHTPKGTARSVAIFKFT